MARRGKKNLYMLGPERLARSVINRYVREARERVIDWADDYIDGVMEFTRSGEAQNLAREKLRTWYESLLRRAAMIRRAYADIRSSYYEALATRAGAGGGGVAPAPA